MATPKIIYTPSKGEILNQFLRDYRLAARDTGLTEEPPTGPGTDVYLIGTAVSNMQTLALGNVQIAAEGMNVLTAVGDDLDVIRAAEGLPEVDKTRATGRVVVKITGTTTITSGQQFVYPNGLKGEVVGNYTNPSDGAEINARSIDTGSQANLKSGEKVRFVSPPVNVGVEATVSQSAPLTGGLDEEGDDRKRQRIFNIRRNRAGGGNWGDIRRRILDQVGSIQDVYIFPALGGPSSAKIVPVRDFNLGLRDYSRAPSATVLQQVRGVVWSGVPIGDENIIQAPTDENADFTLKVTLPDSALSGGNGQGWLDETVWPQLEAADSNVVTITAVTSGSIITVSANTATSPVDGQTNIAWWSTDDRRFYTALVVGSSGSAGSWELTLDRPLASLEGELPQTGDYVSPAAQNIRQYGVSWVDLFRTLGTGENTADAGRLPRAKRHPYLTDEDPSDITTVTVGTMIRKHPEITAWEFGVSATTTPTVPGDVDNAPQILVPRKFGVYKQ